MALAAAVAHQPSSLAEPSWDETIVPTLRQRLQQESRALTKRLSQHSIISGDDGQSPRRPSLGGRAGYGHSATDLLDRAMSPNQQRPSAIPRPSTQDRQQYLPQSAKKPVVTRPPQQRARTQSTPYRYDPTAPNPADAPLKPPPPNGMPTPASSRAASPFNTNGAVATPARPSRIPMVAPTTRQRSGSNSSHGNSSTGHGGGGKPNGRLPPSPDNSLDLFPVMEVGVTPSLSHRPQPPPDQPQIRDEQPPYDNTAQARTSMESLGERPVQHWYRGDTSRNGGVGEIRVVNRKEMLEIATFGHQPSPTRPMSGASLMGKHRRAGSMDRGSWLMEDQVAAAVADSVMDEAPLTDLEDGTDVEVSSTGHQHQPQQLQRQAQEQQQQQPPPPPQEQPTQRPPQAKTPPPAATAPVPMTPKKAPASRPQATPQSKVTTPAGPSRVASQQKRGKPKPTPQKKKTAPATPARAEPLKEEGELFGDEHLIPFIASTPARVGNWDDVVLPAVSKRMGIEGFGVKSEDGIVALPKASPKPSRESIHYEPAPGTFGYDASKAAKRDPREQGDIGEFGGKTPKKIDVVPESSPIPTPTPSPRRPIRRLPSNLDDRPPSPAPFSDYPAMPTSPTAPTPKGTPRKKTEAMPTIMVHPPSPNSHHVEKITVEPEGAGCCKCVIM